MSTKLTKENLVMQQYLLEWKRQEPEKNQQLQIPF